MAKIKSVPKSKFTNSELLNFCLLIINHLNASNFAVLKFKTFIDNFINGYTNFYNSINKISKSVYDIKTRDLKDRLNRSRTGFFNLITGQLSSDVPATQKAAEVMDKLIKGYRNMTKMKYDDLLVMTDKLLKDCESDTYKEYIETLGLTERVTGLRKIYNESMELRNRLLEDDGMNKRLRKSVNTRRELNIDYDRLVDQLNALAQVEGDTDYLELFAWWNSLIDSYRKIISYRTGAGKGGKTDDGETSQHDPISGADKDNEEEERPEIH